ncbi:hypothetical protein VV869_11870 [Photobacterium sp. MCCC 1A19761]|uniref:hypothetical protein n=1 Tax=Photobacterium sp. MCCC 1A19761 TaxID=3115000 RepID=UPI00307CFD53
MITSPFVVNPPNRPQAADKMVLQIARLAVQALIWNQNQGGIFDLFGVVPGFIAASLTIIAITRYQTMKTTNTETAY